MTTDQSLREINRKIDNVLSYVSTQKDRKLDNILIVLILLHLSVLGGLLLLCLLLSKVV